MSESSEYLLQNENREKNYKPTQERKKREQLNIS